MIEASVYVRAPSSGAGASYSPTHVCMRHDQSLNFLSLSLFSSTNILSLDRNGPSTHLICHVEHCMTIEIICMQWVSKLRISNKTKNASTNFWSKENLIEDIISSISNQAIQYSRYNTFWALYLGVNKSHHESVLDSKKVGDCHRYFCLKRHKSCACNHHFHRYHHSC